jgi:phytoene synthase
MLSRPATLVRTNDPDRFLTALFAPEARREALFVLYAFNHELVRARAATSNGPLALIRLHWWREVVEGTAKRHEVATPLSEAIGQGLLVPADLLAMIDAREAEAEERIETLAEWRAWLLGAEGGVAVAAGRLLGAPEPEALRPLGAAWGVASLLRATAALARQGRCLLPADLLGAHGLVPEAVLREPELPAPLRADIAAEGQAFLRAAAGLHLPAAARAAALPAVLARRDLRRLERAAGHAGPRGLADRLAVTRAGLFGYRP